MPLPPKSDKDCVSKAIAQLRKDGYPEKQAIAIAEQHCGNTRKKAQHPLHGLGGCPFILPD